MAHFADTPSGLMKPKRVCTHPKREDRRRRARELHQRMLRFTKVGQDPFIRALARGKTHIARPYTANHVMRPAEKNTITGEPSCMSADARKFYATDVRLPRR